MSCMCKGCGKARDEGYRNGRLEAEKSVMLHLQSIGHICPRVDCLFCFVAVEAMTAAAGDVADREGERIEAGGVPVDRPKLLGFESAIYRIRELHQPNGTRMYGKESATGLYCGACGDLTEEYGIPWPCPTVQALYGGQV